MALKLKGSTSGFVALDSPAVAGNNTITLPDSNGSANAVWANDNTAGVTTYTQVTINRNGDIVTPGTLSIGGTITYEDVTNVDSVGLVTAAQGVRINGGGLSVIGITTGISLSGVLTATNDIGIGDSIFHIGDDNTALRFPAADTFTVETSGTERLRVTSTGNLGINRTTPAAPITARRTDAGGSNSDGVIAEFANSSGYGVWFGQSSASGAAWGATTGDFYWCTSGLTNQVERLRITSAGLVGIGTDNPSKTLTLYGASSSSFRISKSGVLAYDHTFDGSTYTIANNNGSAGIPIVIGTKTAGGESLRITSAGSVGIGTDAAAASSNSMLTLQTTGSTACRLVLANSGSTSKESTQIYSQNNDLVLNTAASERMRITSSGIVLVGGTSATGTGTNLEVIHSSLSTVARILAHGFIARDNYGSPTNIGNGIYSPASNALAFATNSTERLRIDSNGYIGINNDPSTRLDVKQDNGVAYNGRVQSIAYGAARFLNTSGHTSGGTYTGFQFNITGNSQNRICAIGMITEASNTRNSSLVFATDDGTNRTEKLRITSGSRFQYYTSAGNFRSFRETFMSGAVANGGTFTATTHNCHACGTVTVTSNLDGSSNNKRCRQYPISLNSTNNANLGSALFTIDGSTGQDFSVAGASKGVTVTNSSGNTVYISVTFDITGSC